MVSHSDAAPGEFADAARSTFIYAPIAAVVGAGLVAVGAGTEVGFLVFLGVVACIASVVVGLSGVAGMIRSGQRLLARRHEAAGLAIRHYRSASVDRAAASAKPPVAATPAVPQKDVSGDVAAPSVAGAAVSTPPGAVVSGDTSAGDGGLVSPLDPVELVALLESVGVLNAARDVQRLYGKYVCASFINRKCEENGVSGVSLAGTDIPDKF